MIYREFRKVTTVVTDNGVDTAILLSIFSCETEINFTIVDINL